MRRLLILLSFAALTRAQADVPQSITIHVPIESAQRALDEAELMPLLTQDFKNLGAGIVDVKLRRHIAAVARRLEKEP